MDSLQFSSLSSLTEDFREECMQPRYKESYRLAIDHLVNTGRDKYQEFLKGERLGSLLSEEEILYITANVELPQRGNHEEINNSLDSESSSGTYWPMVSDVETPDLDLGWPECMHNIPLQTKIDILFHPPRQNSTSIKSVVCKHIQDARKVIAIVMDMFTDADIFREVVDASIRGVAVYVLLNNFHFRSFLTMAESQHVKIQNLRNMRVRTVKGQEYLCRSGAKFHGTMVQKFLLVDCQTVVYGSYSFTWACEKINLCMAQVITGHLVGSYDEEFRTLYARSTVPLELGPQQGLSPHKELQGKQILSTPVTPQSMEMIERGDQVRNSVEPVYRKTSERQQDLNNARGMSYEVEPFEQRLLNGDEFDVPNNQLKETMDHLKRHSYAGERQDGVAALYIPPRPSNWNVSTETGNGGNNFCMDSNPLMSPLYRGQNMRQSFQAIDKKALAMQQNMPTLDSTLKSFMASWRIESYLKNPDSPVRNSCDYLDQFGTAETGNSFAHSRMRSSLACRSAIPEHVEENVNSDSPYPELCETSPSALPSAALQYSSMQWNQMPAAENWLNTDNVLKRRSLQVLDDGRNNTNFGPARNIYQPMYGTLGRNKDRPIMNNPEIFTDAWQKRHSVADPKSNTGFDSLGYTYSGLSPRRQDGRKPAWISIQNGGHGLNLNEDERSVSHFNVNSIPDANFQPNIMWQQPPCRTMSAAALDGSIQNSSFTYNNMNAPNFLNRGSNKMRSLLIVPEKKEASCQTASLASHTSTDTITAEDEVNKSDRKGKHKFFAGQLQRSRTDEHLSKHGQCIHTVTPKKLGVEAVKCGRDVDQRSKTPGQERFDSFGGFDKKHPLRATTQSQPTAPAQTQERTENKSGRTTRAHPESKLEKLFQRMGSLIHKSKH